MPSQACQSSQASQCPDEETLVDFLENRLSERQRARIESHLSACLDCRDQVAVWIDLELGDALSGAVPVPGSATQRALNAVAARAPESMPGKLFKQTRRFVARGRTMIEQLALGTGAQPVAVRSGQTVVSDQVIKVQKSFDELHLEIEIEKSGESQAVIRVAGCAKHPLSAPVRVVLRKARREAASMLLTDTPVVFEQIPFGSYALVFTRSGVELGAYYFQISAAPESGKKSHRP